MSPHLGWSHSEGSGPRAISTGVINKGGKHPVTAKNNGEQSQMPFKKGQSGNPSGRRRGSPNKLTRTFREAMELVFDQLGSEKHLLAWAKKYPTEYYRIKARMVPPGHTVNMGPLEGSLADKAKLITTRMAEGAITVEQANSMMGVLATQVRIIEADELERRLRELESRVQASARHG